ncbi:protein phosphatase [Sphaerosporella brunnea]|uniref:Protein phosphatase n=1 Tax=Sphaerosporella brunnea TaxID=1250544 RepID=A0A5J5F876_9PEZI|nr:protein phosphatase [Sphaerosporella brunnea]
MDHIKVAKVDNVSILHHGNEQRGTLHLTAHHLIFRRAPSEPEGAEKQPSTPLPPSEIWVAYPIICTAYRYPSCQSAPAHIRLRNRDFSFLQFRFETDRECRDVFDSIKALTVVKGGVEKLYAFYYQPSMTGERRCNGWNLYNPINEFERMGVGTDRCKGWRITHINKDYSFSPTYPATLAVPSTISDTTLTHAKSYRSRARIPALTYLHPLNNCTITRCAQPLTGVRGNRSIQDEKLVAAIFASSQPPGTSQTPAYLRASTPSPSGSSSDLSSLETAGTPTSDPDSSPVGRIYGAQQRNLIVDARPTVNAYAMQVVGMGSEDMDNYRHCSSPPCTKVYLGIDNIHVMRDSLNKVIDAIKDSDITPLPPNRELLAKSGWLKHIGLLLDGTYAIVHQIAIDHSHVLVHCSDGWDRTSQLAALAQICLDPYFRTIDGFITLVEKDWVSFGHRFRHRGGYLGHEKWFVEKSGYGQSALEEGIVDDDEDEPAPRSAGVPGGGQAAAFAGAVLGQAKNFFHNVSNPNGRATSPAPDTDSDDFADRRTKAARQVETPSVTKPKEVSPMFQQFLDGTYQLMAQYPTRFEYNERFLRRLLFHLYSCQYGTFLHDNDKERMESGVKERTRSVWDYFLSRRKMWLNERYNPAHDGQEHEREVEGGRVIFPKSGAVKWWAQCWGREDHEMNGAPPAPSVTLSDTTQLSVASGGGAPGVAALTAEAAAGAVGGMVDSVRGLTLGARTPARKASSEPLGVEMM